ncbi:MAG: carbohydrate ABC transporter substrate-binding protein [Spirochaetaceae bacterium]|nr:MAG: carbohydrate ABC transporter substrate-binding protein [Spirochaetaceae bacterium]
MRQQLRNRCLLVAVLVLAAVLFAACAPEEAAVAVGTDPTGNPWTEGQDLSGTEVVIFGAYVDEDASRFQAAMQPFIEQTGIDVYYEGSGDFEALITVRAEGGDPPDIAAFPQPGLMSDLHGQGHIIDLRDWLSQAELAASYDQSWIDMSRHDDGAIMGVWYRTSVKSLVWYAPAVFAAEGYEIPTSWDELLVLSDQMVADGYTPWSISMESGGATGWVGTDWIEDIMLRIHPPDVYDAWVAGDLPFDSPEVRAAFEYLAEIWFNDDYVLGGTASILTVPFGDGANPVVTDPPRALMHRQASFITAFLPDGTAIGEDGDISYFYLPHIDPDMGDPVLVAGDIMSAMQDRPEVRAVMRYLTTGESTRGWLEQGGFVSPHLDADLSWYPELDRGYAEILMNADVVRFDASDLMPGAVGTGSFWTGMVDFVSGDSLDEVLPAIDASWPR